MPLLCTLLLAAVAPSAFFAGPAKVGDSVTYRVATTMTAAQSAPDVSTVVLSWKAPAKFYARVAASNAAAALMVTRAADGQLALAAPDPSDPTAVTAATLLNQLNFPGHLAAALDGSDHAQTSLNVTPPAPANAASPAPRTDAPVNVPLDVNLLSGESAVTIIAQGNSSQRGSSYGGRSGGSMGGWQSRRPQRSQGQSNAKAPTVDIAMQAIFDQSGVLLHATYRETFTTQSSSGPQTVEHTITIDRLDTR
jgi:hypothetical protein